MVLSAQLAIVLSVIMHVIWNLMARQQPSRAWPIWWVLLAHLLLLAPWGFWALLTQVHWSWQLGGWLLLSALANLVYFIGLKMAYDRAPVALVYPMVRSSPLLIALWSVLFFAEQLSLYSWLGIGVCMLGLLLMAGKGRGNTDKAAIPWALLAMLATSLYSISDKAATDFLPSFAAVVGYISVGYLLSFIAISLQIRRQEGQWLPKQRLSLPTMVIGGLCVGLAYALVVHAMRQLPAAEVVAYTNAGIIFATLASIFIFGESHQWQRRLLSALVICSGLLIMRV